MPPPGLRGIGAACGAGSPIPIIRTEKEKSPAAGSRYRPDTVCGAEATVQIIWQKTEITMRYSA